MSISLNGDSNFWEVVHKSPDYVVIMFFATWCPVCQFMMPHFERAARHMAQATEPSHIPNMHFYRVDVDINKEIAKAHRVEFVPTFVVYYHGQIVFNQSSTVPDKLLKVFLSLVGLRS